MKKNKKLLMYFLALNTIISSYINAVPIKTLNSEKLYTNMVKNIKQGKTNNGNYKLIERALNQKNKELKDIYLQNDYVVKPEYLEWQVFFTGFYEEYGKGVDNTKENAEYHSDPLYGQEGYYENGEYIVTGYKKNGISGKALIPDQISKNVELGIRIPIKGTNREPLTLNISAPQVPNVIAPVGVNVTAPLVTIPAISVPIFSPVNVSVQPIQAKTIITPTLSFSGSGNDDQQFTNGNDGYNVAHISQQNFNAGKHSSNTYDGTRGKMEVVSNSNAPTQNFDLSLRNIYMEGVSNGASHTLTNNGWMNYDRTGLGTKAKYSALKLVGGHTVDIKNVDIDFVGTKEKSLGQNYLMLFHTDAHNDGGRASIWSLDSDVKVNLYGRDIILYGVQYHGSVADSGLENSGEIIAYNDATYTSQYVGGGITTTGLDAENRIIFTTIDDTGGDRRFLYFRNNTDGVIKLNGTKDILALLAAPGETSSGSAHGGAYIQNDGTINLNGAENIGVLVAESGAKGNLFNKMGHTRIVFNEAIEINGDSSIGVIAKNKFDVSSSLMNMKIGNNSNDIISSSGNISGNDAGLVEDTVGIYVDNSSFTGPNIFELTTGSYNIEFGKYSKGGIMFRADNGELLIKGTNALLEHGENNIIMMAGNTVSGTGTITLDSSGIVMVGNGIKSDNNAASGNTGAYAQDGGHIINNGILKVMGENTNGVVTGHNISAGIVENSGIIEKNNNGAAVILAGGSFTNNVNGVVITKNGSAGIYSDITAVPAINGGNLISSLISTPHLGYHTDYGTKKTGIIADNGGIAYYSGVSASSTGNITISGVHTTIMNGGLMFYNQYKTGATIGTYGNFNIASGAGITVEDGGTVFNFDGTLSGGYFTYSATDFSNYITDTFATSISNLNINMPTSAGEYGNLFVLNKTIFNLTTANTAISAISGLGLTINSGGNYRFGLVANGKLNIDNDLSIGTASNPYNLDNPLDSTNKVSVVSSEIEVTSGTYVKGTQAGQILAKMANPDNTAAGQSKIAIINNGNINMSGLNSISFYSRYGIITNNNIINSQNGSISIYGTNNTQINNIGTINLGDSSIGLAAKTQEGVLSIASNNLVNIINTGNILSNGVTNPIAIYALNNSSINRTDAVVTNSGNIDLINSTNSVGAYVSNGTFTLTNTGSIGVGTNGIGVLAENTDIDISGTLNLIGTKAVGLHMVGNSNITNATGTVNVDGTDIVIFNIKGSGSSFLNNLTINATTGSNYILANIDEGLFSTGSGTLTVAPNSVLISGTKSGVIVDAGTTIIGSGTNSVALSANQAYTIPWSAPYTVEAENQGTIVLGNNSTAIYVSDGAKGLNSGNITIGDNSVGIFGKNGNGTGEIKNKNVITIGQASQGLYAENISLVENANIINGAMANSVGMYALGTIPVTNSGTIDLSGDNSVGIFSAASLGSNATIVNTTFGKIKIGNSSDPSNPAVGIYSENEDETIRNDGEIEVGMGSLGIYKLGKSISVGSIQQNGKITVGAGGIGIYSEGESITLAAGSTMILQGNHETVGVYGTKNAVITNSSSNINIGSNNYGFILETGANFINNAFVNMGMNEVLVYSTGGGTIRNNSPIVMLGDENIAVYATNGESIDNYGEINAANKIGNIGIYSKNGKIYNDTTGKIFVGNSHIPVPDNPQDPNNKYAVGIYGESAKIENHADIEVGAGGIGIYIKDNNGTTIAENHGHIVLSGNGAIGLYAENGIIINEFSGIIDVNADDGMGMAGVTSTLINKGLINLNANNGMGMYGNTGGRIENRGTINISHIGSNNIGVASGSGTNIENTGGLLGVGNVLGSTTNGNKEAASVGNSYWTPSIVNSGVINVSEYFTNEGVVIAIKVDPSTIRPATAGSSDEGAKFVSDSVQVNAPYFSVSEENPVQILGSFTQGTNANVYKLKNVFNPKTPGGGPNSGTVPVISKSLTWRATPEVNSLGNIDIWLEKIPYDDFTSGLWYEDFGLALDSKYGTDGISNKAIEIFNKIDMIETDQEPEFRRIMASLAGNVYSNINQRENDISRTFENSLDFIESSENNTKENVKINVISGKGKNKEETDGVVGYDYTTTGVLALRQVERTYKHKFGYSLGYLHTGFEFNDGNESEEWVDTIQLGIHNKYKTNNWVLKNDLMGRVSFHNIDRNIDWPSPTGRSEMNGTYETYSITSDNRLGREFDLGKRSSIMPYAGLRAMYVTRPTFKESGLEALEVEGNDAWSVKPRAGVELQTALPIGNTAWQVKGSVDLAYEYELSDLNKREKAKLVAIEDGYHKLSKPEDEKGIFRTKASVGVEVKDRYGIFITGEYLTGEDKEDDYRAGVTLKAVF